MATYTRGVSRRKFLKGTVVGLSAVGAMAALGTSCGGGGKPEITLDTPLVAYVRDPKTGEVALMVGAEEVIQTDPDLVSRLVQAAGR